MSVKGYKAFNSDFTCLNFKFKEGKIFEIKEPLQMCSQGFHFCENFFDVFEYYPKKIETIICEVEAIGKVLKEGNKSVTDKIKIVKKLSEKELLYFWMNKTNSGYGNSGYGNSGNRNSGDWNSGDGNSGYFNTEIPVFFFNKPSNIKYTKELENKIRAINVPQIVQWIDELLMTEQEKKDFPSYKTIGGFLRKTDRRDWTKLTKEDKEFIKSLPNFDDEVFQKISGGVSLLEEMVEITINNITKKISKQKAKELGLLEE